MTKILSPKKIEEIQEEIFKKMSVEKKVKLALNFSLFCLKLQKDKKYGDRTTFNKNSSDIRKA
ncbi:hypothetical protein AMJ49_04500 [Parcubacteria bacterium DG_74_2]|nr:MAG: hypothetical protein AMJ49_04500 [Parcubacteria bacterium DG_74_2]